MASRTSRATEVKVAIVGGTHGNEYTGVYVVRKLEQMAESLKRAYPKLSVTTLIGNPAAFRANRRFLECDLNRQFSAEEGKRRDETTAEGARAAEIEKILGSKARPKFDVVIDLHTTTGTMDTTIIVDAWDKEFGVRAFAYVAQKRADAKLLYNDIADRDKSPYLASLGKHSLEIECGPTPQGVLRADIVEKTELALRDVLEFCQTNAAKDVRLPQTVQAFSTTGSNEKLAWPIDDDGFPTALVHPNLQDNDYQPLNPGDPVFINLDGSVVPYRGEDVVYPIFVNEGGYYYASSGRGIGLTRKLNLPVPPPVDLFAAASNNDDEL